jgi:hypothetical protein
MLNSTSPKKLLIILATAGTIGGLFRYEIFPKIQGHSINQAGTIQVNETALNLPRNGSITRHSKPSADEILAPFKVVTRKNFEERNYFIKLTNWSDDKTILTLFVRSGETASANVPLGVYKIKIASGEKWYGSNKIFGSQTKYNIIETQFGDSKVPFEIKDKQIFGRVLELYNTLGGNVHKQDISSKDF